MWAHSSAALQGCCCEGSCGCGIFMLVTTWFIRTMRLMGPCKQPCRPFKGALLAVQGFESNSCFSRTLRLKSPYTQVQHVLKCPGGRGRARLASRSGQCVSHSCASRAARFCYGASLGDNVCFIQTSCLMAAVMQERRSPQGLPLVPCEDEPNRVFQSMDSGQQCSTTVQAERRLHSSPGLGRIKASPEAAAPAAVMWPAHCLLA